ncbi:MAG: hypothetical protein RBT69_12680 [Spirochaetia bacterium]|jgi:predicted transcriptional regulator of viral defense system|nr:hypothetical protein [Spirochaetia bacterium]
MQSIKKLQKILETLTDDKHFLFSISDFEAVFPELQYNALKTLLSRAEKSSLIKRVCRGVYLYNKNFQSDNLILYHTAVKLRSRYFNYISLETALSDAGIISQLPINWITIMSSGRKQTVSCGNFGTIEFVHTKKKPKTLADKLTYDIRCGIWRASVELAIQDMRDTRRSMDLIDWSAVDESV